MTTRSVLLMSSAAGHLSVIQSPHGPSYAMYKIVGVPTDIPDHDVRRTVDSMGILCQHDAALRRGHHLVPWCSCGTGRIYIESRDAA